MRYCTRGAVPKRRPVPKCTEQLPFKSRCLISCWKCLESISIICSKVFARKCSSVDLFQLLPRERDIHLLQPRSMAMDGLNEMQQLAEEPMCANAAQKSETAAAVYTGDVTFVLDT